MLSYAIRTNDPLKFITYTLTSFTIVTRGTRGKGSVTLVSTESKEGTCKDVTEEKTILVLFLLKKKVFSLFILFRVIILTDPVITLPYFRICSLKIKIALYPRLRDHK